jgi:hypothetical protein
VNGFIIFLTLKVEATGTSQMSVPRKLYAMIEKTIFKLHHCENSNLNKESDVFKCETEWLM